MGWVTVISSMTASARVTPAHWGIWFKSRKAWANLLTALKEATTAVFTGCELGLGVRRDGQGNQHRVVLSRRRETSRGMVGPLSRSAAGGFLVPRRSWVRHGTLLLTLTALGASGATPKRVLILDSFGHDVAPFGVAVSAFRTTLIRDFGQPVDVYESTLDVARFAEQGFDKPLADFLDQRFADSPVDLVVPIGAPAARFAAKHRNTIFVGTPLLFVGAEPRTLPPDALETNATLVTEKDDLPGMIEDILQIQPNTTNIVVLFGVSPIEQFWAGECRREWEAFTNRLGFSWLDTLSLQQIQERVRKLPPRSFIVIPLLLMDANRVPYDGYEVLEAIHAAANAPIFGYFRSQLGRGVIGGRLYQDSRVGTLAAKVAIRILRGERAADIPPEIIGSSPPTYDWRELTRWGIRPDRLPAGSVIEFREPTLWEQYRWRIVGVVVFCCLQTALIIGLITNRAKRRKEHAVAALIADLSSRFINLPADKVDLEIEAAQRRTCECLGLDISSLWQWSADDPDDLMLTHVCRLLDGPPIPERMSAREYFPRCLQEVKAKRFFALASLDEAPKEAARDVEVFRHFGIKANLTIPLAAGEAPTLGALSFNSVRTERAWPEQLVERLHVVAQIFANALARKRADQELRESEARLSLAADAAGVGLWRLDVSTNCFWVTQKTRELFAFGRDEVVTFDRFLSVVLPEDRELVRRTVQQGLESKGETRIEYRILWPDGRVRWILSRGRVQGETARLTGTSTDITERKQAEESLRASEERLREAAEAAGFGVYQYDLVRDVAFYSPEFLALYGLPAGATLELDPDRVPKAVHPDDKALFRAASKHASDPTGSGMFEVEFRIDLGDGHLRWLRARGRTVFDGGGPSLCPVRANGIVLDITARKQAEFDSQRIQAEITHLSRVAAMGELVASLAHELNQPLTAIQSNAQAGQRLAASGQPDMQEVKDIFADIVADDRRAAEVIRRVRALLKKGAIDRKPLDLNAVIHEVVSLLRTDAIVKGVSVVLRLAPDRLPVLGDRIQLQQVLLNLIGNAFDAMRTLPPGERELTIRSSRSETDGAVVAVEDSGAGIPAAKIARLFEPFFTTKPEGLGMGLVICRSIVESHGGRIWAENAPGRGAVFQVAIPISEDAHA